ncbi:hypothetical protein, partial [Cellulomonas composti]|uniref:hypothetical protein n=1 Tax=Cellulomonas composti TaxID=266130 RepID=UPI001C997BB0
GLMWDGSTAGYRYTHQGTSGGYVEKLDISGSTGSAITLTNTTRLWAAGNPHPTPGMVAQVNTAKSNGYYRQYDQQQPFTASQLGHLALDMIGLIPGIGEPADAINAGWYAAEGNWVDAGFSAAGTIPMLGWLGTAAKWGKRFVKATNTGTALVKYDADFAVGQLTAGGRATASQLDEFGAAQGWARSKTPTGPVKYTDGNGVVRVTIKQGSPRTPGSGGPHVELRNPDGTRIDPFGNPVSRTSPGNHTPIVWDW